MLLSFRVSNFRSFKEEVTFSTVATRLDKGFGVPTVVAKDKSFVEVLPVMAILGANASGKSNLLLAMSAMRHTVLNSASMPRYQVLDTQPFLLDPAYADQPTLMEIDFTLRGERYQYGFEIRKGHVIEEWLHTFPHKRTQVLFDRENTTEFQFGKNLGGHNKITADMTRPQVLYLSAAANSGHPLLSAIYDFFYTNLRLLGVEDRTRPDGEIIRRVMRRKDKALKMLAMADLGIVSAQIDLGERSPAEMEEWRNKLRDHYALPEGLSEIEKEQYLDELANTLMIEEPTIELVHQGRSKGTALPFDQESLGTKTWLSFVTYALEALETGGTLLVDELDASLHPLLLAEALKMFQSSSSNPRGAQLIFTTHDVTLLGGPRDTLEQYQLSRGQIWLVEKGKDGSSTLTALSDYRPRKGEDLARGYMQGRYGGTPNLTSMATTRLSGEIDA
jgi:AAA15 family ATPase/GTPase